MAHRQSCSIDSQPATYEIRMTLSVRAVADLWKAALARGLMAPAARLADIVDVIGPQSDPSVADCLAMMVGPSRVEGCIFEDFRVENLDASPLCQPPSIEMQPSHRAVKTADNPHAGEATM